MELAEALEKLGPIRCVQRGKLFWLYGRIYIDERTHRRYVRADDVIEAALSLENR